MVKLKLASYEQTIALCETNRIAPKLRTLAYFLFEGERQIGYCIFSMEQENCVVELAQIETPAFDLLDGLLKACIAYCFLKGATHFVFARAKERALFTPVLTANHLKEPPYAIEPVIAHCDHDCGSCKGCGTKR